ncbi:MAG: hypothetical protein HY370_08965 [Proteobacteria bacterium]|nr:hypothetical protein [Pseudomonadota bacterium]
MRKTGYEISYTEFGQLINSEKSFVQLVESLTGTTFCESHFVSDNQKLSRIEVYEVTQNDKKIQGAVYNFAMDIMR